MGTRFLLIDERFIKRVRQFHKIKESLELTILIRLCNSNKAGKMQMFTNSMCEETKHFITLSFKSISYIHYYFKSKNFGKENQTPTCSLEKSSSKQVFLENYREDPEKVFRKDSAIGVLLGSFQKFSEQLFYRSNKGWLVLKIQAAKKSIAQTDASG